MKRTALASSALPLMLTTSIFAERASAPAFQPTRENKEPAPGAFPAGMVWIPGGESHRVYVDGFYIDKTDVTNAQFARFVTATHYVTVAERTPRAEDFPGAPPENLVAGSVVFTPPNHPVPLNDHFQWWSYVKGANWRHPSGPAKIVQ